MKHFFLSFTEEMIMNDRYNGYVAGRIEVRVASEHYAIEEIRFFTNVPDFEVFREKWDFKEVNEIELDYVKKIVKERFFEVPK